MSVCLFCLIYQRNGTKRHVFQKTGAKRHFWDFGGKTQKENKSLIYQRTGCKTSFLVFWREDTWGGYDYKAP